MKNIGIINFHCADNYGAVLQAYALQKVLNNFSYHVETIDYRPQELVNNYRWNATLLKYGKELDILRRIKYTIISLINYKKILKRQNEFSKFRKTYLMTTEKIYTSKQEMINENFKYDFFITGSDQVWNPKNIEKYGDVYLLSFISSEKKKISYAASIAENILEKDREKYGKYLKDFDLISVREPSSVQIIKEISNKKVYCTVDPTLLLEKEDWLPLIIEKKINDPYIIVYDLESNKELIMFANSMAKQLDCKIISYSADKDFVNHIESLKYSGPSELLGYIKNSKYVITNSFHGTVFSIVFKKKFITFPHTTRGNRMIDLLDGIGLKDRIVNTDTIEYQHNSLIKEIDYESVDNHLKILKKESFDFLEKFLKI